MSDDTSYWWHEGHTQGSLAFGATIYDNYVHGVRSDGKAGDTGRVDLQLGHALGFEDQQGYRWITM